MNPNHRSTEPETDNHDDTDTFAVIEAIQPSDFDAVTASLIHHSDSSRHLFFPIHDSHEAAVREVSDRLWSEHTADPASHWIFVRAHKNDHDHFRSHSDDATKVIGACQWRFYTTDPFPNARSPALDVHWWPDGSSSQAFTTHFINNILARRARWMPHAHAGMSWIFVDPSYRRRGIGRALMTWGISRTDELGLESFIEATPVGRKLYEACGYRVVQEVVFEVENQNENGDEEWRELADQFSPYTYHALWRPVHGVWEEGEPERTWAKRLAGARTI